jgi:hypothetical protein
MARGGENSTFHKERKFYPIIKEAKKKYSSIGLKIEVKKKNIIFKLKKNVVTFHCGRKGIYPLNRALKKLGIELNTLHKLCGYNHRKS